MLWLDRLLQLWRIQKAARWVPDGSRLLDLGCFQGEFLHALGGRIQHSVGIDPLAPAVTTPTYQLVKHTFNGTLPFPDHTFDVLSMLATIEHIPDTERLVGECRRIVRSGGRVIITVPNPIVDSIVDLLVRLKLAHGMSMEEHHGFDPSRLTDLFGSYGFRVLRWERFQLGLNNLLVFESVRDDVGRNQNS